MKAKRSLITVLLVVALSFVLAFAASCGKKGDDSSGSGDNPPATANYTVTFNTDGATTAKTVSGGAKVEKPSDPAKDGYAFYGWYTDPNYRNAFNFDTLITGNITLYARLVPTSVAANEFQITFVKDGQVMTTAGTEDGVVTALPSDMGDNFVGWWISDYESADMLTYQYDGRALKQNTTFFAVYSSSAPTISVKTSGISWSGMGVGVSYVVKVTDTHGNTLTRNTNALTFDYGFVDREAGDYVVSVTANGNTSSAYFKNKALARVSHYAVDGGTLIFNKVDNATGYMISVDCGNDEHNHDDVMISGNMYDFINCDMQEGGIVFNVTAVGEGYASSSSSFVFEQNLAGLNASVSDDVISWNSVENATSYSVKIETADAVYEEFVGTDTSYSLNNYSGNMTVTVYAEAKGYNPAVKAVEYNKTKLATPAGLKITAEAFTWDAVAGANGYTVKINNQEYTTGGPSFDTSSVSLSVIGYNVSVKANASNAANDSYYTEPTQVKAQFSADDVVYADGMLSWSPIVNASAYNVSINGGDPVTLDDGSFACVVDFNKAGVNTVSVSALNARGRVTDTVEISVATFELNFKSDEYTTLSTKYYAYGDKIEFPTATRTGYTLGNWYTDAGGYAENGAKFADKTFGVQTNMTLYATWKPNKYTVTMVVGEEGYMEEEVTAEVTYGESFVLPVPKSIDNLYGFIGWYNAEGRLGVRYAGGNGLSMAPWSVARDMTIYAGWAEMFEFELTEDGTGYMVSRSSYAPNAKEITIPAMYEDKVVTVVKEDAFILCTNLETINIPDSIQVIETGSAFRYDDNLENINIYNSEVNVKGDYYSYDGALFRYNVYEEQPMMQMEYFPLGREGTYHIPAYIEYTDGDGITRTANVEQLPSRVFLNCEISEVYVPYTVTTINKNAFYNAKNLVRVIFEETPAGETEVPLTLDQGAFYQCNELRAITFTTRMTDFNTTMIEYCNSLEYIDIVGESPNYASVEGMITNAAKDTLIYVPAGRQGTVEIPFGVTSIGANAFSPARSTDGGSTYHNPCNNITKVIIPAWVTNIGSGAFYGCNSLKEVVFLGTIDDAPLTIGSEAFYNTRLESLVLSENVKTIKANAFGNIMTLSNVTINSAYDVSSASTGFAANAFTDKDSARTSYITNINIGKYTQGINFGNSFNLGNIAAISVDPENEYHVIGEDGVLYNAAMTVIEFYPLDREGAYVIPDTVTSIAASFFKGNTLITSVTIGAGVTRINTSAFENCYALESVTFADGCAITRIDNYAFRNCYALESFTLPATVTTFGTTSSMLVFEGCSNLDTITIEEGNTKYMMEGGVLYSPDYKTLYMCFPAATGDENGTLTINAETTKILDKAFGNNKKVKKIQFAGNKITSFGAGLLEGNKTIEEIVLADSITAIGENMFKNCTGLKKFTIKSSITSIGAGAFDGCVGLTELVIEDRTTPLTFADGVPGHMDGKTWVDGYGTFGGTKNLGKIVFPSDTYIGYNVFANSGVTEVEFMGKATISAAAFMGSGLTKATFHGQVVFSDFEFEVQGEKPYMETYEGGKGAFAGCESLEIVDFGESSGITKIPTNFFYEQDGMTGNVYYSRAVKSVNIPDTVTSIGMNAFSYTAIESVVIKNTVTSIGSSAFYGCASLQSAVFEEGSPIKSMPGSLFANCSSLTTVVIPSTVTSIGSSFLSGCSSLESFTIPNGVTSIQMSTFMKTGLKSIFIPAAVTSLGQQAFDGASNLESITFHANSVLSSINGTALRNTGLTEFTFPETGKQISFSATQGLFNGCVNLKKVTLSSGVISNFGQLFINCPSIEEVVLAEDGPFMMEDGFYYNKEGYPNEDTPAKSTLYKALSTPAEFTIPASVKTIGQYAFSGNTTLKKLIIPNTITAIGSYTLDSCYGVEEIIFENEGNTMTAIANYAMQHCTSLTKLVLPDSVATIGNSAFFDCTSLSDVTMNGVTYIGSGAFRKTGIKSIDLSNVATLDVINRTDGGNFRECVNLETVTFGASKATTVPGNIFYGCTSLKSVTFNANQTTMNGGSQFADCTSLESVDLSGFTTLGTNMFTNCVSLESVVFPDVTSIGSNMFSGCSSLSDFTIPSTVKTIGSSAFKGTGFTSVVIPEGVTSIGSNAFENCTSLAEVSLPSTLTTISNNAFANTAISKIVIPAKVTSIGQRAFSGCTNLTQVSVDSGNSNYFDDENGVYSNAGKLIFVAAGLEGTFTVRAGAFISAYAFEGCDKIDTVIIPSGINAISEYAFYGFSGLRNVSIPVTVRSIDQYAFANCTSLEEITLPNSINTVSPFAFQGDTALTYVKMSDSITAVMSFVFKDCTALTTIVLPKNLAAINCNAFIGCSALESIVLPASLKELGTYPDVPKMDANMFPLGHVFEGCTSLTSIVIPAEINVIYQYTFAGWTADQTIYFECEESVFSGQDNWNANCDAVIVFGYVEVPEEE